MINYTHPTRHQAKINYVHPTRSRSVPTPDADGVIRLRRGESVTLRA